MTAQSATETGNRQPARSLPAARASSIPPKRVEMDTRSRINVPGSEPATPPTGGEKPLGELLRTLSRDAAFLVRQEIALARANGSLAGHQHALVVVLLAAHVVVVAIHRLHARPEGRDSGQRRAELVVGAADIVEADLRDHRVGDAARARGTLTAGARACGQGDRGRRGGRRGDGGGDADPQLAEGACRQCRNPSRRKRDCQPALRAVGASRLGRRDPVRNDDQTAHVGTEDLLVSGPKSRVWTIARRN